MNTSLLVLLSFVLGGGGSDLLDYVSTDSYWQRDEIPVTVAAMRKELEAPKAERAKALIADLGSDDPQVRQDAGFALIQLGPAAIGEVQLAAGGGNAQIAQLSKLLVPRLEAQAPIQSVRRLMAIRTLGELKDASARELLNALVTSKEAFESDYAASALAAIDGKSLPHPRDLLARDDVWLLPEECRAVAQLSPRGPGAVDYKQAARSVHLPKGRDVASAIQTFSFIALSAAEQLGNVRLDALSVGLSSHFSDHGGYCIAIFTGQFDGDRIAGLATSVHVPFRTIAGIDVFEPDGESFIFMPSPNRLVLASSAASPTDIPLEKIIRSMMGNAQTLKRSKPVVELIGEKIDESPLWAVVKITSSYKVADVLDTLDTLRLTSVQKNGALLLTVTSHSSHAHLAENAKAIDDAASAVKRAIIPMEESIPALSEASALFRTTHSTGEDKTIITQARLNESPDALFMLPLLLAPAMPQILGPPAAQLAAPATQPASGTIRH